MNKPFWYKKVFVQYDQFLGKWKFTIGGTSFSETTPVHARTRIDELKVNQKRTNTDALSF